MRTKAGTNTWGYNTGNVITTRPTAAFGTSITPGNNTYGSYTSILAGGSITQDCYWVKVNINSNTVSANARDTIVTIGVDASGGTSYTTLIPDLLGSCAGAYGSGAANGGIEYMFPIFVKSGSQLAAKASVNNATVGTLRVAIWLYGAPSRLDTIFYGHSVEAVGIVAASSRGTLVTPGTASEGSWTSLGTSVNRCCYWQLGVGCNDSTMSALSYGADLSFGNGTNQVSLLEGIQIQTDNTEVMTYGGDPGFGDVLAGSTLYGRLQCSGVADSNMSMAAYGVVK